MSNMDLWNAVCVTDPSKTKKLGYGSKLTAIDAYSQIKAATEQFGPVGIGWGWTVVEFQYPPNDTMIVHIRMWHTAGEEYSYFDVCGQASLYTKGKDRRPDDDCAKKALTDAVTKGLSYLGFNADVFEGKFDDSKYVAELVRNQERADKQAAVQVGKYLDKNQGDDLPKNEQEWKEWVAKINLAIDSCTTTGAVNAIVKGASARLKALEKAHPKMFEDLKDHTQGRREILETPTRDERNMMEAG